MKYKEATGNPNQYFSNVKFVNLDIIYHGIRKTKLQKPVEEYQTIYKNDFDGYDQKLKNEMLSVAYRSERKDIFFEKDLDRNHFFEKYPHVELSAMKKRFKKKQPTIAKLYLFNFFSRMATAYQTFRRKLLNYRLEKESEKLLITNCISKIGSVETIEIVLNFDPKDPPNFVDERSYLEDLLEEYTSPDDWYFVPSFNMNQQIYANGNLIL